MKLNNYLAQVLKEETHLPEGYRRVAFGKNDDIKQIAKEWNDALKDHGVQIVVAKVSGNTSDVRLMSGVEVLGRFLHSVPSVLAPINMARKLVDGLSKKDIEATIEQYGDDCFVIIEPYVPKVEAPAPAPKPTAPPASIPQIEEVREAPVQPLATSAAPALVDPRLEQMALLQNLLSVPKEIPTKWTFIVKRDDTGLIETIDAFSPKKVDETANINTQLTGKMALLQKLVTEQESPSHWTFTVQRDASGLIETIDAKAQNNN